MCNLHCYFSTGLLKLKLRSGKRKKSNVPSLCCVLTQAHLKCFSLKHVFSVHIPSQWNIMSKHADFKPSWVNTVEICKALIAVIGPIRSQTEYSSDIKPFSVVAHLNLQECLYENGRKRAERCPLPSSFAISSRRKWASVCGGTVMWFQCLSPHGIIPSGGKPLRLCWRITPPIINSRSALSFLLHLSSFLLTLRHFYLSWLLVSAPSSFTSAHLQHFPPNLQSQQPFLPSFFV